MNLPKAIEIAQEDIASQDTGEPSKYADALQMLIEAGKREMEYRRDLTFAKPRLLPGETED